MNDYKNKQQIKEYLDLLEKKGFETKLFLKELLLNANNALHTKQNCEDKEADFEAMMEVYFEPSDSSITIVDNGIGMSKEELSSFVLEQSFQKIEKVLSDNSLLEKELGLYFVFALAQKISIISKKHKEDTAHKFISDLNSFDIAPCINEDYSGTVIYIKLKDEFAEEFTNKENLISYLNELKESISFDLFLSYYDENFQEKVEKIN